MQYCVAVTVLLFTTCWALVPVSPACAVIGCVTVFHIPSSLFFFLDQNQFIVLRTKDSEGRTYLLPRRLNQNLSWKALVRHLWCSGQPWWGRETSAAHTHRLRVSPSESQSLGHHTHTRSHTTNQAQTQKIQLLKNYKTSMLTAIKAYKSGNGTEKIKQMNLV